MIDWLLQLLDLSTEPNPEPEISPVIIVDG